MTVRIAGSPFWVRAMLVLIAISLGASLVLEQFLVALHESLQLLLSVLEVLLLLAHLDNVFDFVPGCRFTHGAWTVDAVRVLLVV